MKDAPKIGIIGLGYVGLPLAQLFATKFKVVGFDINAERVNEINTGFDRTSEISTAALLQVLVPHHPFSDETRATGLYCSIQLEDLGSCTVYIVTVPTPTDAYNRPVLTPMIKASETIAGVLKPGDTVIYESTVYPGVTEEQMVPILERISGLRYNRDFYCGYSPERINPGDKVHTVAQILKVTSGSTPQVATAVDNLYRSVITAGTYKAPSIKVAEAAKVIENAQRDINIAFVNELSKIFNLLDIDTQEVLTAASTKWNFLPFKPGLVGGHCIGVDPYYLAQKAQEVGYHPEIILAGRRLNDSMGKYVAQETIKLMMRKDLKVIASKVLILGFTFKEDCPDVRNTRVIDIYKELRSFDSNVDIYDPCANPDDVKHEYGITILSGADAPDLNNYAAVILAVAHQSFLDLDLRKSEKRVVYDVKSILPKEHVDARL